MLDSLPVQVWDVPFTGDGPSFGIGGSRDQADIGQQEMIVSSVAVQYSHAYSMPYAPKYIEMSAMGTYPTGDNFLYGLAPVPVVSSWAAAQDTKTPDPFSLLSLVGGDLGAPPIDTGNSSIYGRC